MITENCNLQFFVDFHAGLNFSKGICIFSFILRKDFSFCVRKTILFEK